MGFPSTMKTANAVRTCVELVKQAGGVGCLSGSTEIRKILSRTAAANSLQAEPLAALQPTDEKTVEKVVAHCSKHDLPVSILGGGHTIYSSTPDTVVLDLCKIDSVNIVNTESSRGGDQQLPLIRCQGGASLQQIVRAAALCSYTVPLGTAPTVGAGAVLMGGVGHLSRLYGLSVNNIVGMRIVTPCGGLHALGHLHKDDSSDAAPDDLELYWAARGGAPGIGVVTEFTMRCFPSLGPWVCCHHSKIVGVEDFGMVKDLFFEYGAASSRNPLECSTDCYIHFSGDDMGISSSRKAICWTVSSFGPQFRMRNRKTRSDARWHSMVTVESPLDLFEQEHYLNVNPPADTLSHARSVFLSHISQDVASLLARGLMASPHGTHCTLHLQQGGGATSKVHDPPRCAGDVGGWEYSAVITSFIPIGMSGEESETHRSWVDGFARDLASLPEAAGVYATDLGPQDTTNGLASKCWTPDTHSRLFAAKCKWDPTSILQNHAPFLCEQETQNQNFLSYS